ncbi:MAG TPA: hypothetical protein VE934_07495 [Polaromonas sp.]|uniref:hypothetical protein n=1 Tax=Polaromonas sp. TaxID=1869339 RepID=UPI002D643DB9|nr:hypothetical protein [Polaromonas sp.]HYW56787.1 hypothetical protein [Polaromonas sp.]
MSISPYFLDLGSAYQSEIDDLRFDSEGCDVLQQRLAGKRREIGFLVQMMDISPEMVAVVFHQGFEFREKAVMEHLLTHGADALPDWGSLTHGCELKPWAQELADIVLKAPGGNRFLTLTAGLEYMAGLPNASAGSVLRIDAEEDEDKDGDREEGDGLVVFDDDGEGEESGDERARQEAGADWLVQQGFDQKD